MRVLAAARAGFRCGHGIGPLRVHNAATEVQQLQQLQIGPLRVRGAAQTCSIIRGLFEGSCLTSPQSRATDLLQGASCSLAEAPESLAAATYAATSPQRRATDLLLVDTQLVRACVGVWACGLESLEIGMGGGKARTETKARELKLLGRNKGPGHTALIEP